MNVEKRALRLAATCGLASLIALSTAGTAAAEENTERLTLSNVFATLQTGQQDVNQQHVAACKQQVSLLGGRYLDTVVTTHYKINPQTKIMSAESSLPSPKATQPLTLNIPLHPLGVASSYSFGAFKPAQLPNTYVLFSVDLQFKSPQSSILVLNADKPYNCLVSSNPNPFKGALQGKLGVEQGK